MTDSIEARTTPCMHCAFSLSPPPSLSLSFSHVRLPSYTRPYTVSSRANASVYPFAPANPNRRVRSFSSLICFSPNGPAPIFPMTEAQMHAYAAMSTFLRTKLRVGAYMMHRCTSAEASASSCQAHVNVLVSGISIRLRAF